MSKDCKIPVSEKISKALLDGAAPVAAVTTGVSPATVSSQVQVSSLATLSLSATARESSNDSVPTIRPANQATLANIGLSLGTRSGLKLSKNDSSITNSLTEAGGLQSKDEGAENAKVFTLTSQLARNQGDQDNNRSRPQQKKRPEGK